MQLVHTLWDSYGVRSVAGVRNGYRGFYSDDLEVSVRVRVRVSWLHERAPRVGWSCDRGAAECLRGAGVDPGVGIRHPHARR